MTIMGRHAYAAAERLAKEPGSHASRQVQWVRTTVGRYEAMQGDVSNDVPRSRQIYVVQLTGTFVCKSCSRPSGAKAPTGTAEQVRNNALVIEAYLGEPAEVAQL